MYMYLYVYTDIPYACMLPYGSRFNLEPLVFFMVARLTLAVQLHPLSRDKLQHQRRGQPSLESSAFADGLAFHGLFRRALLLRSRINFWSSSPSLRFNLSSGSGWAALRGSFMMLTILVGSCAALQQFLVEEWPDSLISGVQSLGLSQVPLCTSRRFVVRARPDLRYLP